MVASKVIVLSVSVCQIIHSECSSIKYIFSNLLKILWYTNYKTRILIVSRWLSFLGWWKRFGNIFVQDVADPRIIHGNKLGEVLVDPDLIDAWPLDVECLQQLFLSPRSFLSQLPLADRRGREAQRVKVARSLSSEGLYRRTAQGASAKVQHVIM